MLDEYRLFGRQSPKYDQHREKPGEKQSYTKRNQELHRSQKNQRFCKQDGSTEQIDSVHLSVGKSNGWRSGEQEVLHCKGQARRQSASINGRSDILEQAFKAADILVQNGGFEMIAVDLSNVEERQLRKVPLTTWFRFARVAEKTQTTLIFLTSYPAAHLCAALTLHMRMDTAYWEKEIAARPGMPCAAELLTPKLESFRSSLQSSGEEELERPGTQERSPSSELVRPNLSNEGKFRTNDVSNKEVTTFLHTQLLGGFSCELGIGQARKPVQQAQAKFTAKSMWK